MNEISKTILKNPKRSWKNFVHCCCTVYRKRIRQFIINKGKKDTLTGETYKCSAEIRLADVILRYGGKGRRQLETTKVRLLNKIINNIPSLHYFTFSERKRKNNNLI